MSTSATAPEAGPPPAHLMHDESRWGYRRSLASRVTLLVTMAVGLSIALVALGAFVTVKMSLESSLDNSLLERAHKAAEYTTLAELTGAHVPAWATGAADVRIFFIDSRGYHTTDSGQPLRFGKPEQEVAAGNSAKSLRTISSGSESRSISSWATLTQPAPRPPAASARFSASSKWS